MSCAVAPADGALLLAESDAALYAAKRAGRDQTVIADDREALAAR